MDTIFENRTHIISLTVYVEFPLEYLSKSNWSVELNISILDFRNPGQEDGNNIKNHFSKLLKTCNGSHLAGLVISASVSLVSLGSSGERRTEMETIKSLYYTASSLNKNCKCRDGHYFVKLSFFKIERFKKKSTNHHIVLSCTAQRSISAHYPIEPNFM